MRTFVAVWPPQPVVDRLRRLLPVDAAVRRVPARGLHVTLRFLGDVPPDEVAARLRTGVLPAATARLGPRVELLGSRIVMAPVDGLATLAAAVDRATADLDVGPRRHPFRGHVTLARCRDPARGRALCGALVEDAFEVTEVAVVSSQTRPDGARYTTEAVVPLDG